MKTHTGNCKYQNQWTAEEYAILLKELLTSKTKLIAFKNTAVKTKRTISGVKCKFYAGGGGFYSRKIAYYNYKNYTSIPQPYLSMKL
jgi:hypothetical protein